MSEPWVEVIKVVHQPNYNTLEDGVKKDSWYVRYDLHEEGMRTHRGDRVLLALDPLELFTKFRSQMQRRWSVEPNNVRWETTAWVE